MTTPSIHKRFKHDVSSDNAPFILGWGHDQSESVGVHLGGGGSWKSRHCNRPSCQDDQAKVVDNDNDNDDSSQFGEVKSQFVFTILSNFQVSDSDNKVDNVHRSHGPGRQTSTSLGQLQSRRLAPTDNQLGGQQQQQQQQNSIHILVLKVWNLHLVTRLHRFTLNPDASFLIWRRDTLVVAPLFTGVVQVPQGFMSSEELLLV